MFRESRNGAGVGIFDQIKTQEQTPEQIAELEKWHEGVKQKAAAALEAREERFRQAEKDFEEMAAGKSKLDEVTGELIPLKFEKPEESEESARTIDVLTDHFSPDAVRQDFLPRETIPPPPMRQVVHEIHPEAQPVVSQRANYEAAAIIAAIDALSKRIDVLEANQELLANKTLNAVCNSLNEMLSLVRRELEGSSAKLVDSAARSFEPALKPVLVLLAEIKKDLEPKPEPEKIEPAKPEPEPAPEPAQAKSLGEICLDAYRTVMPASWPASPDDSTVMELAYDLILKQVEYSKEAAVERFWRLLRDFNKTSIESGATRHPKTFYEYVKTI